MLVNNSTALPRTKPLKRRFSLGSDIPSMLQPEKLISREIQAKYYGHHPKDMFDITEKGLKALSQVPDLDVLAIILHGDQLGNISDNYNRKTNINDFLMILLKFKIQPKEIFFNICYGKQCLQKISQETLKNIYDKGIQYIHTSDNLLTAGQNISKMASSMYNPI
jgi:hypothetical protein